MITPKNYMNVDMLDIIFEGRHKDYGAYELRKKYDRTIVRAFIIAAVGFTLAVASPLILERILPQAEKVVEEVPVLTVNSLAPPPPMDPKTPPPPPIDVPQPKIEAYVPPVVTEKEVQTQLKSVEEIAKAPVIGTTSSAGNINYIAPPVDFTPKTEVKETKKPVAKIETIVEDVDEPAKFDGWAKYLSSNLRYPPAFANNPIPGEVTIRFVVERDGSLTDLRAIKSTNDVFTAEAMRVLRLSPQWTPGKQNGKEVRSPQLVRIKFTTPGGN